MVVQIIFDVLTGGQQGNDGDFNDRLNHRYTAVIFGFLAIFAMSTQLIGSPINCWAPGEFHPAWHAYTDNVCFVNKTYFIDPEHHVSIARRDGDRVYVEFYQWYPVVLILMGVLFYVPQSLWTGMLASYQIDLNKMVNTVDSCELVMKPEDRQDNLWSLSQFLDRHFSEKKSMGDPSVNKKSANPLTKLCFKMLDRESGASMGVYYFVTKVLALGVALAELFLLNLIIGPGTWHWGFNVMGDALSGVDWTNTWRFPMTTFCDFQYHNVLGTVQQQTVQCVLGVNLYNEKIFLFVWAWLIFMIVMNSVSILNWFTTLFVGNNRVRWIEKYILMGDRLRDLEDKTYIQGDNNWRKVLRAFVRGYLKPDGVFMLRLVGSNTTNVNMTDLICNLWDIYIHKERIIQRFGLDIPPLKTPAEKRKEKEAAAKPTAPVEEAA